jgi:hypothetical protein
LSCMQFIGQIDQDASNSNQIKENFIERVTQQFLVLELVYLLLLSWLRS